MAETSEDLSFKRGDRILILERVDSDWYKGRLRDREGIFPAIFVRPCPGTTAAREALTLQGDPKTFEMIQISFPSGHAQFKLLAYIWKLIHKVMQTFCI